MTPKPTSPSYINTIELLRRAKRTSSELTKDGEPITHFSIVEAPGDREVVFGDRKVKIPRNPSLKPGDEETGEKLDALSAFASIAIEQVSTPIFTTILLTAFLA